MKKIFRYKVNALKATVLEMIRYEGSKIISSTNEIEIKPDYEYLYSGEELYHTWGEYLIENNNPPIIKRWESMGVDVVIL
jgi:hypothetical protein